MKKKFKKVSGKINLLSKHLLKPERKKFYEPKIVWNFFSGKKNKFGKMILKLTCIRRI